MLAPMAGSLDVARTVASRTLDLALPPRCVGCAREGQPICHACRRPLDGRLASPAGWPIGMPVDLPAPLVQLEWCAAYAGVVRTAVHALKYGGERRLAGPLGEAVARRWDRAGVGGDLLVPVPVHPERLAERGYDQAVLIAEAAAPLLHIPARGLLVRRRATTRQFDLDRDRRAANVAGAFVVGPRASAGVEGRWIVLVDDVVTTGSTLASCAEALLADGAMAVSAIAVARER